MAENSNIAKSLTMVETTVEPDPNANIIINDNGKVRQASVDNLLENSDINTSLEKKETILGEIVIPEETETGWYKVAGFIGTSEWCLGNCNFKIYTSSISDIFNLTLRCTPLTSGYNVNEMHINSLYGLYDNSVGVIVEQNITYLVIRHRNNYKTRIVINSIITEFDAIKLQSMTPVLYSTDESPTLSLTPTGEISDIKNTLSNLNLSGYIETLATLQNNEQYTIDKDCTIQFIFEYRAEVSSVTDELYINGIILYKQQLPISYYNCVTIPVLLKAGSVIRFSGTADFCHINKIN